MKTIKKLIRYQRQNSNDGANGANGDNTWRV
jgi:hypothetical protein